MWADRCESGQEEEEEEKEEEEEEEEGERDFGRTGVKPAIRPDGIQNPAGRPETDGPDLIF